MSWQFENFDKSTIRAIMFARAECQELGYPQVEAEHLLLGLLDEEGDAARLLWAAGLTKVEVLDAILKLTGPGSDIALLDVPFAASASKILVGAESVAKEFKSEKVTTVHLLAALLRITWMTFVRIMEQCGVEPGALLLDLVKEELEGSGALNVSVDETVKPSIIPSRSRKPTTRKAKLELVKETPAKRDKPTEPLSDAEREKLKHQLISDEVQDILRLATDEALQANSECVGTEHVLLAIFLKEDTIAQRTLRRVGITFGFVKSQIAKVSGGTAKKGKTLSDIEFSAQLSSALLFANNEMRNTESRKLESEHLLIGIVQETEGLASKILSQESEINPLLDINSVRKAINNSRDAVSAERLDRRQGPLILSDRQYMKAAAEPNVTPTTLKGMSADTKKVLVDSAYEAVTHGATEIGDEHVLLGLLSQQSGLSKSIFDSVCLELNMVRRKALNIERKPYSITWTGLPSSWNIQIPLAKDTKKLIMRGRSLARDFRSVQLKPEHLLLAILERKEGRAVRTLLAADVNLKHLKKLVVDAIEQKAV